MTLAELTAQWMNKQAWLTGAEPEVELRQAREEGLDITSLEAEFDLLMQSDKKELKDAAWHQSVGELLDKVRKCKMHSDFEYNEPSDYHAIVNQSERIGIPKYCGDKDDQLRRLHGGLLGRICGCILGKPFECFRKSDIEIWARATQNWPLSDYLHTPTDLQKMRIDGVAERTELDWAENWTRDKLDCAVEDDDINYTIAGFDIVRKYGPDFRPVDVAEYWCANLPLLAMCTAERVAYRNFTMSILPPESATYRNPYREWIGAQIRADSFGYLNPGNPARAAEWAWRDASVSHVKNGIYGEMWVAAMLAAAYVVDDFAEIIRIGLSYVPMKSRFREGLDAILEAHKDGATYDDAVGMVHSQWDEASSHGWCHTISNAQLVAIALLWGENDYGLTITRAVMPGFDTDCNAATAGSVWGVVKGVDLIPSHWSEPFDDTMRSHLLNWRKAKISDVAKQMAGLVAELR